MGGDTLHAHFYLEESPGSFVLTAANGSPAQSLIVDRKTGDVSAKSEFPGGNSFCHSAQQHDNLRAPIFA